ncbi:hypothetical protein D9M68_704400 [compost metagenome]
MLHGVEAERQVLLRQVAVDVEGGTPQLVGAQGLAAGGEVFGLGDLGHQVDAAAGGATAGIGRARALDDLHALQVEHFMGVAADVANAVDHDVGGGLVATDERTVAHRGAAFACAQGDPRRGAQDVLEGAGAAVADQLFGDHRDRAGGIAQGRGEFGRRRLVDLVALDMGGAHVRGAEFNGGCGALVLVFVLAGFRSQADGGAGGEGQADGRAGQVGRGQRAALETHRRFLPL